MSWIGSCTRSARGDRAVSTVLDAAVFLLLVSAAVGVLYTAPQSAEDPETEPDVAAETATTLATSIETIEYVPAPGGDSSATGATRRDRGTIAELLAEATVANARLGEAPFTRAPDHERAIRNATRRTVGSIGPGVAVQVRTRWRPLPGSGLRGGIVIGPDPPADADVHASSTAVPVGTATATGATRSDWASTEGIISDPSEFAIGDSDGGDQPGDDPAGTGAVPLPGRAGSLASVASETGCSGLGHVLGARAVGTAFPPERTDVALRAGGDPAELTKARYATAASALGQSGAMHAEMQPRRRNEFLTAELAPAFESACGGYESPTAAAERAAPGTVVVSVRTWSS